MFNKWYTERETSHMILCRHNYLDNKFLISTAVISFSLPQRFCFFKMDLIMEQLSSAKFSFKTGKTATETFLLLKTAFGEDRAL